MTIKTPNIFIIGPMGSGKTTIGKRLARELGLDFYDSDTEIEVRTGVSIPWIFDVEGEEGFRVREQQVIAELTTMSGIVLATGGGSILSPENRSNLAARGTVIYLRISIEHQLLRTQITRTRPLLSQTTNLKETLLELKTKREHLYAEVADFIIDTDQRSVQTVINEILDYIRG